MTWGPRVVLLVALSLLAYGVALARGGPLFFESKQSYRQVILLASEITVIIETSLAQEHVDVRRGGDGEVVLDIAGQYTIAGYHGSRESAGARELTGPELAFGIRRTPETLILSSPEWWHIHHTLALDHLTITLPASATVTFRRKSSEK